MSTLAAPTTPTSRDTVLECLERVEGRIEQLGPDRWRVTRIRAMQTPHAPVLVTLDGDWLAVAQGLPAHRVTDIAPLRRWGSRALDGRLPLPPGVRPVIANEGLRIGIRGERALIRTQVNDPITLGQWLTATAAAGASFAPSRSRVTHPRSNAAPPQPGHEDAGEDIAATCEAAGWTVTSRGANGDATVELPAGGDRVCHVVVTREHATMRLRVALTADADARVDPVCHAAVILALLRVADCVRMVRAIAVHANDSICATLEVRLNPPLGEVLLNHALSALGVAHEQVANEFEALAGDTSLARAYLSVQGVR